jgi:glycine/D-amino acid oxidase-like deaminating enzyme
MLSPPDSSDRTTPATWTPSAARYLDARSRGLTTRTRVPKPPLMMRPLRRRRPANSLITHATLAKPRILVIGAGIIGTSIAWRLAARGASVNVIEAGLPGGGATDTSLAWVNASSKLDSSREYFDLAVRATAEHHALADALGEARCFFPTGNIEISRESGQADRESLRSKVARLQRRGYRAELGEVRDLRQLDPGLKLPATAVGAYYADEGWVDGPAMARALLERARSSGAKVLLRTRARQLVLKDDVVTGVRLTSRGFIGADIVVIATGRWTQDLLSRLRVDVPMADVDSRDSKAVGLLVTVLPTAGSPRTVVHSHRVNWAPRPSGYAVLASASADRAIARNRSAKMVKATAGTLLKRAADLSDGFADASVERARIGLRALPIDGWPVCGWINSIGGLYVVVTHSGITLAPLLSQLVAEEIFDGVDVSVLRPFRPSRFDSAASKCADTD